MIKLNAGFSRKVGEPNYGSRGASVNVELELESNLIGDPDALLDRIKGLYDIARRAVEAELYVGPATHNGDAAHGDRRPTSDRSMNGPDGNGRSSVRPATASQARAIRAICDRSRVNADQAASQRFGVRTVEELTLPEASTLIDELKANADSRTGGGR
jgi:hypothetical protein